MAHYYLDFGTKATGRVVAEVLNTNGTVRSTSSGTLNNGAVALPLHTHLRIRLTPFVNGFRYSDRTIKGSAYRNSVQLNISGFTPTSEVDPLAPTASAGGGAPLARDKVTADAPHSAVLPHLPAMRLPQSRRIKTVNRIRINNSVQFPVPVSWSEDSLLKIIVQNPSDSGQTLHLGYGLYQNQNHQGQPDTVDPGSEWVGYASSLPVFARTATSTQTCLIISERSA